MSAGAFLAFAAPLGWRALFATWDHAWLELRRPPPAPVRRELLAAWSERARHYHDARHLRECLAFYSLWQGQGERGAEVVLALWFHDAVYEPGAADNELRSAAWAARVLGESKAPSEAGQRVYDLVMATRHDAVARGIDAEILVDIDLAILGSPTARFADYEQDIRKEYAFVPEARYRAARRAVLQRFLERAQIYKTLKAKELLEAQARSNLQSALERLCQ